MSKLLIPNTTQVPNVLLDEVIPKLPPGAVRVLLAIVRKTYGFQKSSDCISYSQLQALTGLSREGVNTGIKKINEKFCSLLKIIPGAMGKGASEYSLNLDVSTGHLVRKVDQSNNLTSQSCGQEGSQKSRLSKTNKTKPIRRPHSGDAKSPSPGHKATMVLYCELFSTKFNSKPHIVGGKDGKLLSDLLRQHPPHEVQDTLRLFFKKPPDWVARQSNYTIGTFAKCFTQLLAMKADRHNTMRGGFVG